MSVKKLLLVATLLAVANLSQAVPASTELFAPNFDASSPVRHIGGQEFLVSHTGSQPQRMWDACIVMKGEGVWADQSVSTLLFKHTDSKGRVDTYRLHRSNQAGKVVIREC